MFNLDDQACLVLGATGFLGQNLCRRLVVSGARIRAVARKPVVNSISSHDSIDWRYGDFHDQTFMSEILRDQKLIFHLISSSVPGKFNNSPGADFHDNVVPTVQLAELALRAGAEHIVFLSSGGTVYGCASNAPLKETSPTDPISAYGVGKLTSEKYLGLFSRHLGLKTTILRIANPYGPFQSTSKGQGLIAAIINCALLGKSVEIWGDGSNIRDFIYVDDVIDAIVAAALYKGSENVFNVGSGIGVSVKEMTYLVSRIIGIPANVIYRPQRHVDVPVNILDNSLVKFELKWSPKVDLENGLLSTFDWLKKKRSTIT